MLKEIESTDVRNVGVVIDKGVQKNSEIKYFLDVLDKKLVFVKLSVTKAVSRLTKVLIRFTANSAMFYPKEFSLLVEVA